MSRAILPLLLLLIPLVLGLEIDPSSLRTNAFRNPISVNNPIRLSWHLTSSTRNSTQTAYQVQFSHTQAFSPPLWDTDKTASQDPWAVYTSTPLPSRSAVFWRVRVWDGDDTASEWSPVATFEVSLLQDEDWDAEWITNDDFETGKTSLPRFVKTFDVACNALKARLYIVGLGLHYPLLNSVKVGSDVLSPGYATLNKTIPYSIYDVLDQLRPGRNVLAVELGKGIYDNTAPLLGRHSKFKQAPRDLMLLARLEYTCEDGAVESIASDESWLTTVEGPWVEAHWYGGEEYDARRETNWTAVEEDRSSWKNASVAVPPSGKLTSPRSPPLQVTETIIAKSVYQVTQQHFPPTFITLTNAAPGNERTVDLRPRHKHRRTIDPANQRPGRERRHPNHLLPRRNGIRDRHKPKFHRRPHIRRLHPLVLPLAVLHPAIRVPRIPIPRREPHLDASGI